MQGSGAGSDPEREHGPRRSRRATPAARAEVNRAARTLRLRFLRHNDVAAFRELVLLVEAPLLPVAHAITREVALAVPASQLLADYLAEVFTDLRFPPVDDPDPLHAAEAAMRRLARQRLELLREATARGEALPGLLPADAHGHLLALAGTAGPAKLGAHFLVVVNHAFHDLSEDDRRLLLTADVDRSSPARLAEVTGLAEALARRRLRKARVRLAASIATHFISLSNPDRDNRKHG